MADYNEFDSTRGNRESISRRPRDTMNYPGGPEGGMGPEDYDFDVEGQQYASRQRYYRTQPAGRLTGTQDSGYAQRENQRRENRNMADRQRFEDDDWAQQVRQGWQRGPYRDYGWESHESVLPEFRDPSVHRTQQEIEEMQQGRRQGQGDRPSFGRAYDYERAGNMPLGADWARTGGGPGYEREALRREEWNQPGPFSGRGPKGYQRSNERIREDVCERLTEHGYIDASNMEVRVDNGEVWLTGMVDSRQTKRRAEDVVDGVPGVKDVHNELRVRNQSGSQSQHTGQSQEQQQGTAGQGLGQSQG